MIASGPGFSRFPLFSGYILHFLEKYPLTERQTPPFDNVQGSLMLPPALVPPAFDAGSVWLVGAGPGDPGLLTLHALHALQQADIILHDALVPEEILSLAPQARLEAVGKRAGGTRTPQLRINQRLIALARQGLRVVRLKGGDPLIFGRGGEEALALAAAGIPFRIVPGDQRGHRRHRSAGIPLTHRGLTRTVTFATGHDAGADLDRICPTATCSSFTWPAINSARSPRD